jgi:hypothetical protein
MIGVLGFDSWRWLGIFLFTTVARTSLEPTEPPIQRVLVALSPGVKRPGRETDHSPPSSANSRISVHGAVLNTGTILPLLFMKLRSIMSIPRFMNILQLKPLSSEMMVSYRITIQKTAIWIFKSAETSNFASYNSLKFATGHTNGQTDIMAAHGKHVCSYKIRKMV